MTLLDQIREQTINWLQEKGHSFSASDILVNATRKEFAGHVTVVVFPFVKLLKDRPPAIAESLGDYLVAHLAEVASYNVVQGFVNLELSGDAWSGLIETILANPNYGEQQATGKKILVEFCSPNTNKPLHLGHIRNIMLGWSCSQILAANGHEVTKIQIINDRGIAVCKSMLAWKKFGNGATPQSTQTKGDAFVGEYYVLFDKKLTEEYQSWQESDEANDLYAGSEYDSPELFFKSFKNTYFNTRSTLGQEAREMLVNWEAGDQEIISLWEKMNAWVYAGFDETYAALDVHFDKLYYESNTWTLGKDYVEKGISEGLFFQKEDQSVWVDLTDQNMDEKILLRSDGTSVYLTQDIGTAIQRYEDFNADSMIYVVGDEQNYHFKVLFEVLKKLEQPFADALYHLSYGMVDLPSGKMKSREGTVVDADDLIREVTEEAHAVASEKGELDDMPDEAKREVYRQIGLAALKFFILKVNPQKRMLFDPAASVDMQGQTGPYIQNAYVRVQSLLRKSGEWKTSHAYRQFEATEEHLLQALTLYPEVISKAGRDLDPSGLANYCYDLAKSYHRFYHEVKILSADTEDARTFRLRLSKATAQVIEHGMNLLGIDMPERM
ncbi:MAG: arginine--tRNA ligase [Saprospiraceae bacterium]|nr:arginine--tRNA ligase [Saprospiraceae bacterium]